MFHSTVKSQPHLSQREGEKTPAQIGAGSHQVRVKLLVEISALSFPVLKSLFFSQFPHLPAQAGTVTPERLSAAGPISSGPQCGPLHIPDTSLHGAGRIIPPPPPAIPSLEKPSGFCTRRTEKRGLTRDGALRGYHGAGMQEGAPLGCGNAGGRIFGVRGCRRAHLWGAGMQEGASLGHGDAGGRIFGVRGCFGERGSRGFPPPPPGWRTLAHPLAHPHPLTPAGGGLGWLYPDSSSAKRLSGGQGRRCPSSVPEVASSSPGTGDPSPAPSPGPGPGHAPLR